MAEREKKEHDLWRAPRMMGLSRCLAKAGYGSRAQTKVLVESGRVSIDGKVEIDPSFSVEPHHVITLDDVPLREVSRRYFVFHKPARVACNGDERRGHRRLVELLPRDIPGLMPAGRMDSATSGLLLLSNDAGWNDIVTAATWMEKEYEVQVTGTVSDMELGVIAAGMHLPMLGFVRPMAIEKIREEAQHTWLRLVVTSAKNRQVRRIFSTLRHDVTVLRRVRLGAIRLASLPPGDARALTSAEINTFRREKDPVAGA